MAKLILALVGLAIAAAAGYTVVRARRRIDQFRDHAVDDEQRRLEDSDAWRTYQDLKRPPSPPER